MKIYKVTVSVLDQDGLGADGILTEMENVRYPNHCMAPKVRAIEEVDIGEWRDDHPLNRRDTADVEFRRLFAEKCWTCGGGQHPSGKVCICGGSGLHMDEVEELRARAWDAED